MEDKKNLLGLDRAALEQFFSDLGEKPFRARQLLKWLYQERVADFSLMTDLSKVLREKLSQVALIEFPEIISDKTSLDGTRKWVFRFNCQNSVEAVFIPEDDRGTLCISSQAGCALACPFCSTGKQGFNRNLTAGEIISQVWLAKELIGCERGNNKRLITNIVFMGMGEPLLNLNPVISAVNLLLDDFAFGLSRRRITISTSGIVPAIERLGEFTSVALAISLHAPNDELRNRLVPINQRYGLEALIKACQKYLNYNRQHGGIVFEYVMLKGINDQESHAVELAHLLKDIEGKINLIPFNPFPDSEFETSPYKDILNFQKILNELGFITTIRKTRGDDIDGACGQLVGQIKNRKLAMNN